MLTVWTPQKARYLSTGKSICVRAVNRGKMSDGPFSVAPRILYLGISQQAAEFRHLMRCVVICHILTVNGQFSCPPDSLIPLLYLLFFCHFCQHWLRSRLHSMISFLFSNYQSKSAISTPVSLAVGSVSGIEDIGGVEIGVGGLRWYPRYASQASTDIAGQFGQCFVKCR